MLIIKLFIIMGVLFYIRYYLKNKIKTEKICIGNDQTIGKRKEQEDSFSTIISENGVMAVIADGMGGYINGKIASSIAVNTFVREFSKLKNIYSVKEFFLETSFLSNKEILEKSKKEKMGTTLAAVLIKEDYLYWTSVGDSAIALFRDGEFINLNKKHIFESILNEQYISRKITKQEVINNPMKKRLTNYIGHDDFKDIEISKEPIRLIKGDKIVLCSDGVYNSISEFEIENILMKNIKPYKASEEIINVIKNKNYLKQDNATIIILQKNS